MKKIVNILATVVAFIAYFVLTVIPSLAAFAVFGNLLFKWFYPLIGIEVGVISAIVGSIVLLIISGVITAALVGGYMQLMVRWDKPFLTIGKKVYE